MVFEGSRTPSNHRLRVPGFGTAMSVLAVWFLAMSATPVAADPLVDLHDRNSSAGIDLGTAAGMFAWDVDHVQHLYQQWFWYRIGPSDGESSLDTLGLVDYTVTNGDFDPGTEHLAAMYGSPGTGLSVELGFTLAGSEPGSGQSDITETITISNDGSTALELHFFEYCNLDLGGTEIDANARIVGGNTAEQVDGPYYFAETVTTPMPSHRQVDFYPSIINSLTDPAPTVLTDAIGPIGPGDMNWAFQWDFVLGPGQSFIISKDKLITPEPATLSLLSLGGLALLKHKRKS